jgi:hypothetical protein
MVSLQQQKLKELRHQHTLARQRWYKATDCGHVYHPVASKAVTISLKLRLLTVTLPWLREIFGIEYK